MKKNKNIQTEEQLKNNVGENISEEKLYFEDFFKAFFKEDGSEDVPEQSLLGELPNVDEEISESENLFKEAKEAYNKIDDKLLDFIENFVVNQNAVAIQKKNLKNIFFWFTMISFALIVLTPIICLIVLMVAKVKDYYIIFGSIVAALIEVLTTVIVLPKIVAEYLFNKEEEKANIQIVELMQQYSDTMHGYDYKEKHNNHEKK